jgi:hypothetical protein
LISAFDKSARQVLGEILLNFVRSIFMDCPGKFRAELGSGSIEFIRILEDLRCVHDTVTQNARGEAETARSISESGTECSFDVWLACIFINNKI